MGALRAIGLLVLGIGVVLQPVGWIYTHWLTAVSIVAIFAGVFLVIAGKETSGGDDLLTSRSGGRGVPGDVHGHSGQMSGGRSASWEAHNTGESSSSD